MKRNPTKSYITNSLLYLLYLHPSNVEQNSFRSRRNQSVFTSRPCLQSKQTSSYHSWLIVHWWRYSFTLGTRSTRFFIRITNSLYQWIRTRGARLSLSLFLSLLCPENRDTGGPRDPENETVSIFWMRNGSDENRSWLTRRVTERLELRAEYKSLGGWKWYLYSV